MTTATRTRTRATAFGEMVNGYLQMDRPTFARDIQHLPDGPVKVLVTHLQAHTGFRQMQKYWHAVPVEICREHFGVQHDPMHYALLGEWRGYMDGPLGERIPICSASRKLDRAEWTQLIDWVLLWGPIEHGLHIPEPDSALGKDMTERFHRATHED